MKETLKAYIKPAFLPLGTIVSYNAKRFPDVVALTQGRRETTWAEFDLVTNQLAHGLSAENIDVGARIVYLGKTTDEAFQIMHGTAKARCVFTPLNWRLAADELKYIICDANPALAFVAEEFLPLFEQATGDLEPLPKIIVLESTANNNHAGYQSWLNKNPGTATSEKPNPADVALQLYTSGTTGLPKGVLISHDYMINLGRSNHALDEDTYDMRPGEEHLNYFPIFHTSGAVSGQYLTFSRGCGIVIMPDFDPEEIFKAIDQRAIPTLGAVPTMLQAFLSSPAFLETDFSQLRYVMYGAAPMPIPLRDKLTALMDCRFSQGYGATESVMIACLSPDDHEQDSERLKSVGRAMPGVEIKIVDSNRDTLPAGEIGEVALRSPIMAIGYANLPDATATSFVDGWYFTGDGGYLDKDGYLFLKERIKDMIISGGENIYPAEIENILYAHPDVESAAVVAVDDKKWGEVPLAFIVVRKGSQYNPDALRSYVGERLAKYKQPKFYEKIDALPLNASGKVLKKDLRALGKSLYVK